MRDQNFENFKILVAHCRADMQIVRSIHNKIPTKLLIATKRCVPMRAQNASKWVEKALKLRPHNRTLLLLEQR